MSKASHAYVSVEEAQAQVDAAEAASREVKPVALVIAPQFTVEQLLGAKGMGPAIVGKELYEASQAYVSSTSNGVLGPAILETPRPVPGAKK